MAEYIVAYTINSDSKKGILFSDFLGELGLKEAVDQSTRYGCYGGDYRQLMNRLQVGCEELALTTEDTVLLFSAGKNNNATIKKSKIV